MDAMSARLVARGSPFELQETRINDVPCKIFANGPQSLRDIYRKAAAAKDREFVVSRDARVTSSELFGRASSLAESLRQMLDVSAGSRVAIVMRNCPEWLIAFIAVTSIGATAVLIHADSAAADLESALIRSDCQIIVCDLERAMVIRAMAMPRNLVVLGDASERLPRREWIDLRLLLSRQFERGSTMALGPPLDSDSEAVIAFTSGSTGIPKGVILSHRNLVTGLMNMLLGGAISACRETVHLRGTGRRTPSGPPAVLILSALSHIGGYAQVLLMLHVGGRVVLLPKWYLPDAANLIASEKVRALAGATPEMIREIVNADRSLYDVSSLSGFYLHGSALQAELVDEVTTALPQATISTGYGLTETCGSICVASLRDLSDRAGTSGEVLPTIAIKLASEDGAEVTAGDVGEVNVRGAMTMHGYCGMPEATAEALRDGWFRTGDLARLDADGFLYIVGRARDLIQLNDRTASPTDLERAASRVPDVAEVAVLGLEAPSTIDELLVAVMPKPSARVDFASIQSQIIAQMGVTGLNMRIVYFEEFPRTASGKIDRLSLRRRILSVTQTATVS